MFYILKVWICTCLVAPVVLLLVLGFMGFENISDLKYFTTMCLIMFIFGLILSIPTFIILFLLKLLDLSINPKYILNIVAIIGILISFGIFDNSIFDDIVGYVYIVVYSIIISFFIWLFKLEKPQQNS